jgi:hypothetical protein
MTAGAGRCARESDRRRRCEVDGNDVFAVDPRVARF